MNKGCKWILILLITAEAITHAICVGYSSGGRHSTQRSIVSRRPLLNDEYVPPIPVHISKVYRRIEHSDVVNSNGRSDSAVNRGSWIPLKYPDQYISATREVYVHPLAYREHVSMRASSPVVVTNRPETFDIPLRKSIRVAHSTHSQPAIQTTGYIKETLVKRIPIHKTISKPKHTILVDSPKQTTAQSVLDVAPFDGSWKPRRITTIRPSAVHVERTNRKIKPIPFTRFSDSNNFGDAHHHGINGEISNNAPNQELSQFKTIAGGPDSKTVNGNIGGNGNGKTNSPPVSGTTFTKFIKDDLVGKDPYFVQPDIKSYEDEKITNNSEGELHGSFPSAEKPPQIPTSSNPKKGVLATKNDITKVPDRKQLFVGVEYADSEIHRIKDNPSYGESHKKFNDSSVGNENKEKQPYRDTQHPESHEKRGNNELKNQNSQIPSDVLLFNQHNNHNATKIENYIQSTVEKQMTNTNTPAKSKQKISDDRRNLETDTSSKMNSDTSKSKNVDSSNEKYPKHTTSGGDSFSEPHESKEPESLLEDGFFYPNVPFFSGIQTNNNNKNLEDVEEDRIYFPQIFPEAPRVSVNDVKKNSSTVMPASDTAGQVFADKIKFTGNSKHVDKNFSGVSVNNFGNFERTHYNPPKAVTTNDFSSSSYHLPTSPSIVTVSSDNSENHQSYDRILNPKRTSNKVNETDIYILERKPSLFPDTPGSNRPRKPNIKISSGMLAGILIAALIFLGFLTGTMVFAFHQLKFSNRNAKKKDRHKKRTAPYAPEYLDENFAGNTYIHNNIFLPNPQNLEERLEPDMDTSFSVDSDDTSPVTNQPSTSSYGNMRNKSGQQQDENAAD